MKTSPSVDAYVAKFPAAVAARLKQIRAIVRKAAPKAEARIAYGIIGFYQDGYVVYAGGFKKHIGMYPTTPRTQKAFPREMAKYRTSTGTLQFPHDEPLPTAFIQKFVNLRLKDHARGRQAPAGFRPMAAR